MGRSHLENPPESPFAKGGELLTFLKGEREGFKNMDEVNRGKAPFSKNFPFPLIKGRGLRG